jgi:hypothetical protein
MGTDLAYVRLMERLKAGLSLAYDPHHKPEISRG